MRRNYKPKTWKEVKDSFKEKVNKKPKQKSKQKSKGKTKEVFKRKDILDAKEELRAELIAFYSTPEGRAEIDDSPHGDKTTKEAVDLLMQDIDIVIKREIDYE